MDRGNTGVIWGSSHHPAGYAQFLLAVISNVEESTINGVTHHVAGLKEIA